MRALVQRVTEARVRVDGQVIGEIGPGLCCLVGVTHGDDRDAVVKLAAKLWNLRIFADEKGHMNRPVADNSGELMVVSQFTLYGDTRKGRRPSFIAAAAPDEANKLIDELVAELRRLGATVATGSFGANMVVELTNDGPVTLMLEV
ncbi:MAG: D-tyrosyl-tRNA(Tyr) deacylase [Acidimicrobiaceae bacterium]|nr:D-tyrosyl-tRNA(Tyr) deacylase [Acidimicrobiaceae bacterium]MXZ65057.1 D-tyrosyl-tRNA(Tyr) deacylase [Acidimicrobiaceae bacterium]MYF34160.1 D-tyrosyl-tRNA(Tyr) deacylase [Acidimicrobiaceae bacterium]MYG79492.1 D-tyrosyl-tRNA(Tyr) deacylase [Acidimicrobiaceae bacterium]MYJ83612.1 D-tyrosyl-tRNA(Tyr) deacylase [Acidimicrobiaceae bacterium]